MHQSFIQNSRKVRVAVFSKLSLSLLSSPLLSKLARSNSQKRNNMGITSVLWLFFIVGSISLSSSVVSANQLSLDVAQPTTLQISPRLPVEKSPGSKHGAIVLRERVLIHGLSRLKNLRKFAHSVKVNVSIVSSSARLPNVEVCFHRNFSLGIGMCPQGQWEKLVEGSWVRSMSPFDHKLLDVRMVGSSLEILQVSLTEEFFSYRIIFLVLGIINMTLASSLSKSLVFYYSSAMAVGIILVILVILFQSSVDPLLAAEALLCGVVVRRITRSRFIRHLHKNLRRTIKHGHRYQIPGSSPSKDSYDEYVHNIRKPNNCGFLKPRSRHFTKAPSNSPIQGLIRTPPSQLSDSETHYSSFHKTPERRKFSKDVWEKFTKDSTKKALEELVSSPDFSKLGLPYFQNSLCPSSPLLSKLARSNSQKRNNMGITSVLWLFFIVGSISLSSSVVSANQLSLDVAQPTTLQISPRLPVEKSPGSKHGAIVLRERVLIHGLSRLKNLRKFAHSVKVNVSIVSSSARLPNVEVCFHRNFSLGIGMCPQGQWEKLVEGSWVRSMSPFDHKLLDVRMVGSSLEILQVSLTEEFFSYRIIFLVLGIINMTLASSLSKSLVFYYSSAMAVGIILVILVILFQSSVDPLLAAEALLCGVVVRRITRSRFIRHLHKNLRRTIKHGHRYQIPGSSPSKDSYDEYVHNIRKPNNCGFLKPRSRHFTKAPSNSPIQGLIRTPPSQLSDSETHYSSFHKTPERRKFSKDVWEKFTKDSTKKALEELVSSPDFSKWAVINAERITLSPKKDTPDQPCIFSPSRSAFEILLNPDHKRNNMGITSVLWLFFIVGSISLSSSVVSANELSLDVAQSTTLQISPRLPVEKSPGSKHGAIVLCERVLIHGLSRLKNLRKFAHSVKVNVSSVSSSARLLNVEVCFHRNFSLGIGMCPQGQWEKLVKGSWVRSMSPFDHKLLDVRMIEFFSYRIIFLVLGIIIMTLASSLSNSLVFYYSSAMAVGIILVILVVLFQVREICLTVVLFRLGWVLFSSATCQDYCVQFLQRWESAKTYFLPPSNLLFSLSSFLAMFLLVFLVLAGAWLGFWVVRKLVLTEDGLIDIGVSQFVAWSIRIIASVMILQSSVDPLLAAEALLCGVVVSLLFRRITRSRFIRHLYKNLRRTIKHGHRYQIPGSSPSKDSYDEYVHNIRKPDNSDFLKPRSRHFTKAPSNSPIQGLIRTPPSQLSDSETHYSSFHKTPERRKFSKDEWEKFTKDSTKKALEELVSSPDFSKWAVVNAERITLTPKKDTPDQPRKWIPWF
ncbi:hypothetical protein HYC85_005622 [Camellia sinensis]|uniref:Transmembrane protein n=1 Tax=Camellia sinensis TaxID=4442 RepID=A0A7J7I175_CAMSI|nr:hypothetical protein HYC85_005622 [Camellia sinensis]